MKVIQGRNAQQLLPEVLYQLARFGEQDDSRNGPVLVFPEPVTLVYEEPRERVVFWPSRDANPFFHLFEAMWMLAGRDDVETVARYVKNMRSFSDDGETFHGAYGHRWRFHFNRDQIDGVTDELARNPNSRRAVLQVWDARTDLAKDGKDFPCNTQAVFSVGKADELNMTVFNRSNDIIWGALGANAVHWSILQEYIAERLDLLVGTYHQVSNNMHAYLNDAYDNVVHLSEEAANPITGRRPYDPYELGEVGHPSFMFRHPLFDDDIELLMEWEDGNVFSPDFANPFFAQTVKPMTEAHRWYRENVGEQKYLVALEHINNIAADDWRMACQQWVERRYNKWQRAADDGPSYV